MLIRLNGRIAIRLAIAAAAALSMAACAKKAPPPVAGPPPAVTQPQAPPQQPVAPPPAVSQSILPGSQQDFIVNVGDRVYFDTDQYSIRADASPVLDAQAGWLRRYPGVTVRIEGNADERGTREYNLALAARRANSVRDFLVAQGVTSDRISTISYGKEQPIDAGTGEEAWQRNRNARTSILSGAQ